MVLLYTVTLSLCLLLKLNDDDVDEVLIKRLTETIHTYIHAGNGQHGPQADTHKTDRQTDRQPNKENQKRQQRSKKKKLYNSH